MFSKGSVSVYRVQLLRDEILAGLTKKKASPFKSLSCFAATFINAVSCNSNVGSVYLRTYSWLGNVNVYLFRIYILIFCRSLPTFPFLSCPLSLQQVPICSALSRTLGHAFWIHNPILLIVCLELHRSFLVSSHKAVMKVSGFLWPMWSENDGLSVYAQPAPVK